MRLTFVTALSLLLVGGPARAQDDEELPAAYEARIDEAIAESAAGHWTEARALFREAHRIYPNARSLRGIGMTSYELRDYPAAYRTLALSLEEPRRPLTPEQREQVTALLARVRQLVARYTVTTFPEGSVFFVDGVRRELEFDGYLMLASGTHEVAARAPGREPSRGRWTVRGGEDGELPIAPPAMPAPPPAPAVLPVPTPAEVAAASGATPASPARSDPRRTASVAAVAGGGALAVTGAAMLAVGLRDIDEVEGAAPGTPWDTLSAANARAPRMTGAGIALLAVGAATVATGTVLLLTAGHERGGPQVRAAVGPGGLRTEVRW